MEFRIRDIVIGVEYCNILLVEGNRSAPPCTLTNNHNAQFFSQNDKKYTKVRPEKLKLILNVKVINKLISSFKHLSAYAALL